MAGVRVQLFGGPADGAVRAIDECLLGGYSVPQPLVVTLASLDSDPMAPVAYRVHTYRWDGTFTRRSERRMRWQR